MHFIKIPESFLLHYKELRSANTSIATGATIGMAVLYVFGGLATFLFFIQYNLINLTGIVAAFVLSLFQLFSQLSKLPLIWESYNTAVAPTSFLLNSLISILFSFIMHLGFYSFIFCIAEALTRKAFGSHPQLWRLWNRSAASSWQVWGRTIGGYLIVPLDILFAVGLYIVAQKYFGWWIPAGTLTDPNILAQYAPWLSAFTSSLAAGALEECLFRAIPLASACLWGERFGKKKLFIGVAFVVQIIIFGAAHASYPTQPAYARLIELIIPSSIFGGLYLAFGLLPAIISHVIFDVFWFALPLFISQAPGAWINQVLVILLSIVPLAVITYARLRSGSWHTLAEGFYNKGYKAIAKKVHTITEEIQTIVNKKISLPLIALVCMSSLAIGSWLVVEKNQAPTLTISRTAAIAKAGEILKEQNVPLESPWEAVSMMQIPLNNFPTEQNYIWQKARDLYTPFMNSYLRPPLWCVRFIRFEGTPSERAEEYRVFLADAGTLIRTAHILPEDALGKTISKEEARALATQAIKTSYNLSGTALKEISAQETVLPARKDWLFIFADLSYPELNQDEARISVYIAGDQITDQKQSINVPEQWAREQQNKEVFVEIIKQIALLFCSLIFFFCLMLLFGLYAHRLSLRGILSIASIVFAFYLLSMINNWPITQSLFNTAAPFSHQLFKTMGMSLIYYIFLTGIISLIAMLVLKSSRPHTSGKTLAAWLIGIGGGLVVAGVEVGIALLTYQAKPLWADYSALGAYIPIGLALQALSGWLIMSCGLTMFIFALEYIHKHFHYSRYVLGIAFVCGVVLFSASRSLDAMTPILLFLLQNGCMAVVLWLVYEWFLHFDYALLGVAFAACSCVALLQQALFNAYPLAPFSALGGIVLILVASWYWFKIVNKNRK